jgi:hypothetical protein
MLTDAQRVAFAAATAHANCGDHTDEFARLVEPHEVVETRETLDDFRRARGTGERIDTPVGSLHCWRRVQAQAGTRRGDLYVMDFGDARAAHFDV